MIHGYTPSCIAMSLHKMRHPINQTMYSFESVDVDEVLDFLQKDNLLDPLYKNIFQVELKILPREKYIEN